MRLRWRAFLIPVALGAAACASGPTEVMVVVTSDLRVPNALDHLRIEAVRDHSSMPLARDYDLTRPQNQLPLSLGLLPSADVSGELQVVVTGTLRSLIVAMQTVTTSIVPNETRTLDIRLSAGVVCGLGGCSPVPTLTTSGNANTPLIGLPATDLGGQDMCPGGSILIGFDFGVPQDFIFIDGLRAHCGVPRVAYDGTSVVIDPGDLLSWAGPNRSGNTGSLCPSNQAVIGVASRHGQLVDQLALRCAPLSIDAKKLLAIGSVTTQPAVGGTGGSMDPATDCPGNMVAAGDVTRADNSYLYDFGLACTNLVAR